MVTGQLVCVYCFSFSWLSVPCEQSWITRCYTTLVGLAQKRKMTTITTFYCLIMVELLQISFRGAASPILVERKRNRRVKGVPEGLNYFCVETASDKHRNIIWNDDFHWMHQHGNHIWVWSFNLSSRNTNSSYFYTYIRPIILILIFTFLR